MSGGPIVRWWDKHGGWQFGRLIEVKGSDARVSRGSSVKKVPAANLREWPPPPPEEPPTKRKARRR